MDEIEIKAEDEECLSSSIGVYIEPPPFRSIEEATEFLHNHELATNNKYVVQLVRNFSTQGVASMKFPKIRWTYQLVDGNYFDGTPHAIVGIRKYNCQYGNGYREVRQRSEAKQKQKKIDQGRHSGRTRAVAPSKKINCPAQAKMTLIVKFPDYAISENTKAVRSKMGSRMRHEFSDDTQRYILVYLRIFYHHEHGTLPIHLNNDPSKITQAHVASSSTVVLKPGATLRGRSLVGVTAQFSCFVETPSHLAQPSAFQRLEMMPVEELLALYWDLTGQTPNDVFTDTQQEFTDDNLRILLHLCIIFANAESENDGMIVAHRSVRVAGTENDFEPITCFDSNCGVGESHMHCPLCARQNIFTDTDKLKTHYKKKHVDRSLEYAGLKILRCRDECVVKGLIKDVKAYTSGHWHCWKCDMGYEKLNSSSITHFKSHIIGQTASVMVTESVFPSVNPHTVVCNLNPAQMETFNIPPNNGLGRPKRSSTQNKNAKALKELNDGNDVSNAAEIQYGADIHNNNNDDDDDDVHNDTDMHDVISDVTIPASEVNQEYMSMSLPSSLPVGDAVYTLTNGDGNTLLPEYENTVVYVQQDNEEQVFYTTHPDGDEVVIKIPEQDERLLLQEKVAELEQKCLLLERTNLGQKSHITLLNQKIEDLKSKQFTCSDCSAKKTKTDDLLESLKELHTKYRKKHESQPGSCSVDNELTEGFINLWREIKELKRLTSSSVVSSNANDSGKSGTISVTPVRAVNYMDSLNDDPYSDGDSDMEDMSDGDLTMFGAESWEGSGNKRRKMVHLPLPDNAAKLVKKCGKTSSEEPDKTQVCRVWSADDKDKLTQTDKRKQSIEYSVAPNSDKSYSLVEDKSKPDPVSCIQNQHTGVKNNVKNSCSTTVVGSGSVRSVSFRRGQVERLNSNIAVSSTISSSSSTQGIYSHTSSSVVPVTSKVELVMNSDSQKPIVIKSVRLKPQVKEKIIVVEADSGVNSPSTTDSVVNSPSKQSSVVKVKETDNLSVGTSVKSKPCDKNLNPSKSVPVNYGDNLSISVNAGKSVPVKTGDNFSCSGNTSEMVPVSAEVKLNFSKSETKLVTSGKKSKTKRAVSDTSTGSPDLGASSHKKKQPAAVITPQTHAKIKITSERCVGTRSDNQSADSGMRTRGASTRRGIMWTSPNNNSEDVTPGKKRKV